MPMATAWRGIIFGVLILGGTLPAAPLPGARNRILSEREMLHTRLVAQLEELAARCEQRGQTNAASEIRRLAAPDVDLDDLPGSVRPAVTLALPADERDWQAVLRKAQQEYAAELFRLSQQAVREGLPSLAFHLVRETAFHDPDHAVARRLLGYVRSGEEWTTPFAALMQRQGHVWHERFGWLPRSHVQRYEQGERYYQGRWMSAEKEAALRATIANGWVVESDHFRVKTNVSLERGVELSQALEDLHRFFTRNFADLFNTPQQMQQLFDDGKPRTVGGSDKHEVWYLRSREEFVRLLRNKQTGVEGINGLYLPRDRRAYFFANPEDPQGNLETMYHEVTHQLLSESSRTTFDIATERDFWVVEGLACYLESFDRSGDRLTVGDPTHIRLYWARERVVAEQWFLPLREFASLGMREFQFGSDYPTLQKYYSQATGLTHFFLHYQEGRYRDGFIQYVAQLYSPDKRVRLNPQSLEEILGVSSETLDAQYREYIVALPTQPAAAIPVGTGP